MSKLTETLRFQGRYGHETEDQMRARKFKERIAAADELESFAASHQRLKEALETCVAAIERTHHVDAAGRLAAADKAREALRSTP